jgi:hypothetical protein
MTIEATRDLATRLIVSTRALAAFGLALEERAAGLQLDPANRLWTDLGSCALGYFVLSILLVPFVGRGARRRT